MKVINKKPLSLVFSFAALTIISGCSLGNIVFDGNETIVTLPKNNAPEANFTTIELPYTHQWNANKNFPYTGAAVIDIDGDGNEEIFIGGGDGQDDALFTYQNGTFTDIIAATNLSAQEATHSALSFDVDNDGDTDLIVTRASGISFYLNNKGKFTHQPINITFEAHVTPLNTAIADINNDGLIDLYVSNFVSPDVFVAATFNDEVHAKKNLMLLNKGDFVFEDVTEQTGTAASQNTFHSTFVELNGDNLADLVVSNNTGKIEIFKNNGNLDFELVDFDSGLGYWMGIGVGDIDNDGDQDLFLPNIGVTIDESLLRGDLRDDQALTTDWILLRNDGNFKFTDISKQANVKDLGFGWGGTFEDINLDGKQDLLVPQNYVNWPKHKYSKLAGKALIQSNDGKFYQNSSPDLDNARYGQSNIIVDLNNDNKPDVIWINMNDKQVATLNQSTNNAIRISLPDNLKFLNANVYAQSSEGRLYARQLVANTGMLTDSANDVYFAVKEGTEINKIVIALTDGSSRVIESPKVNTRIIVE